MPRSLAVGLLTLCVVGCGEREATERLAWDETSVDPIVVSERVVLGGSNASGPSAFASITSVALLPGLGRMAVADGTTDQVHEFLTDGTHLWTRGGRGFGPGEFRALNRIGAMPDGTLCAWDIAVLRVTMFDTQGGVVRTAPVELGEAWDIRPPLVGFGEGCAIVVRDEHTDIERSQQPQGPYQDTLRFGLYDQQTRRWRWLAEVPNAHRWLYRRDRGWGSIDLIFGRSRFATLSGQELLIGTTDSLAWTRVAPDGAFIGRAAIPLERYTVGQADVEEERQWLADSVTAYYAGPGLLTGLRQNPEIVSGFMAGATHAVETAAAEETFPVVDQVTATTNGVVWVERYPRRRDPEAQWLALDLEGKPLGRLALPKGSSIVAASHDWIVVQERDAFDAPVLRILAVTGGIGPPDP
jgi:hypothetical protein